MSVDPDRAVVILGDPADPRQRGVEQGTAVFQGWTRGAWGKKTRKEHERRAQPEMAELFAVVEMPDGETMHFEPYRVRFVKRTSKLQYPNC